MAITFPRVMPLTGYAAGHQFELERFDHAAPEDSGRIGGITSAPPKWMAVWPLSQSMSMAMSDEWRAWVASLRGQQRMFMGVDVARRFPAAYPAGFYGLTRAGGGAFDGSALSWSQSIDGAGNAVLSLTGLPAGFAMGWGDYIGWHWTAGTRRALVRTVEPGVADGSGAISLTIEPPVDMRCVPPGATAHLNNPCCIMKLVKDKTELGGLDRMGRIKGGTITGAQVMLP